MKLKKSLIITIFFAVISYIMMLYLDDIMVSAKVEMDIRILILLIIFPTLFILSNYVSFLVDSDKILLLVLELIVFIWLGMENYGSSVFIYCILYAFIYFLPSCIISFKKKVKKKFPDK